MDREVSESVSAFLDMGGFAAFVWPSFAITAVVLVGMLVASLRWLRSTEAALAALQAERGARRGAGEAAGEA
ncbi:MAG: heme exporter protein CcmD [Alphaproteobacteria bacterium]|nr:heme exporter protein CcmD [Alphaproteobacteria bacterium]